MLDRRYGAVLALACLAACGSGGSGGTNSGAEQALFGQIVLQGHSPAADAVQVSLDASITLRFDSRMVLDCFADADTWLRPIDEHSRELGAAIQGSFVLAAGGSGVTFTPDAPLQPETDYLFQVSPLTCDVDGRILETAQAFGFRTTDTTPPTIVGADVTNGQTGRSRTAPILVTASEALLTTSVTPQTVVLRDVFGQTYACTLQLDGSELTIQPIADLPGDRQLTLRIGTNVTDRAGNPLQSLWSVSFRTALDSSPPSAMAVWPADGSAGVSPAVQPVVTFSESMDPFTVEPSSLVFQDEFGSVVAFAVHASPDQRTLRVRPLARLQPDRRYFMAFLVSAAAVTDVSGIGLDTTLALSFATGADATPPALASATPAHGETRVSINAAPTATFDEPMDGSWVGPGTVELREAGRPVPAILDQPSPTTIRVTPILPLDPAGGYELWLGGGHAGLRDTAGNVLAADIILPFTAAADGTLPGALLQPGDGGVSVPTSAHVSIVFDSAMDVTTLDATTCQLMDDARAPVAATLTVQHDGRGVVLTPVAALQPGTYYRTLVRGGPGGVRERTGNWLGDDLQARFRTGFGADLQPPTVTATLNGLPAHRRAGIVVPPAGFTIEVDASDPNQSLDMGSVEIQLDGPVAGPDPTTLFTAAQLGFRTLRVSVPAEHALVAGDWTLRVQVSDLTGNVGTSATLPFAVSEPTSAMLPFERTQLVWARTDLDRDGDGAPDFDQDLLRLGLATVGDPAGTNARARRLMLDAILAHSNSLFGRGTRGEPLDEGSVAIRFTTREPIALHHMQIALGGLDPEGRRDRRFGDDTTGVLGRAFYDYRNGRNNDRNIGTSPGLGVFPAELWLYQAGIHLQVYPSFQTMFAQRFLPLCPDMGGTPVGSHPQDAAVLDPAFDPAAATSAQLARHQIIHGAIDDWSLAIGTILAHEVGHAVGLVAPGPAPSGLFGDSSLHNAGTGAAEVMAPAVGYEAMLTLDYDFRDINLAYLRQRILLR